MKELNDYLNINNGYRAFTGRKPLDLNNPEDRKSLFNRLQSDLCPDHLTMDGELSRAEVKRRYEFLIQVQEQLEQVEKLELTY